MSVIEKISYFSEIAGQGPIQALPSAETTEFESQRTELGLESFAGAILIEPRKMSIKALVRLMDVSPTSLKGTVMGPYVINEEDGRARSYNGIMLYRRGAENELD